MYFNCEPLHDEASLVHNNRFIITRRNNATVIVDLQTWSIEEVFTWTKGKIVAIEYDHGSTVAAIAEDTVVLYNCSNPRFKKVFRVGVTPHVVAVSSEYLMVKFGNIVHVYSVASQKQLYMIINVSDNSPLVIWGSTGVIQMSDRCHSNHIFCKIRMRDGKGVECTVKTPSSLAWGVLHNSLLLSISEEVGDEEWVEVHVYSAFNHVAYSLRLLPENVYVCGANGDVMIVAGNHVQFVSLNSSRHAQITLDDVISPSCLSVDADSKTVCGLVYPFGIFILRGGVIHLHQLHQIPNNP